MEANTIKDELSTEDKYIRDEAFAYLMDLVFDPSRKFTPNQQLALYETHVLEKNQQQIADDLGVTVQAVSLWYNSGIKKLKKAVKNG